MSGGLGRVGLISLEPWNEVWRRNQYVVAGLLDQQLADHVVFVEPPEPGRWRSVVDSPRAGVTRVAPALPVPKRAGGLALAARLLRGPLAGIDLLWVNDPALGVHCLRRGLPAVYDVTDDWREFDFPPRIRRRIARAEDRLARAAATVVCSEVLRQRWQDRYAVTAAVVPNGIDAARWLDVTPVPLPGPGPHVGYVGTLHEARLDIDLVAALAADPRIGTVHLVGPDACTPPARERLAAMPGVLRHGAVPAGQVAAWTVAMDVLVSPHLVSPFTLSLDAIKSYEYLASRRPIVATPTSGFQVLTAAGLTVVGGGGGAAPGPGPGPTAGPTAAPGPGAADPFVAAVVAYLPDGRRAADVSGRPPVPDWGARARQFAAAARGQAAG